MEFRALVALLESHGELLTVRREVDRNYELPALLAQAESREKAVRFENVSGSDYPVVGGVLTSLRRWAMGLGLPLASFDEPNALDNYVAGAVASPLPANVTDGGAVAEVVIRGGDIDTGKLPAPLFFSGDSHPFISAGLGFARDPSSGQQNVGFYRVPVIDRRRISLSAGPTSHLRVIYKAHGESGKKLQVALAVGVPPALQIAAAADLPAGISDVDVAGALQRKPLEMVRCQTSDIMVPADAEFVLEATVNLDDWVDNVMGEFGDQYGKTNSPTAMIDAITHRRDPMFHVIMAGMNREHNFLGRMLGYHLRAGILDNLGEPFPTVRDLCIDMTPQRTGMRAQVIVSVDKESDDEPRAIIDAIYAMQFGRFPLSMLMYRIVVVDQDVDIRDHREIDWAIASRMNSAQQFLVYEDKTGRGAAVTRLGYDATAPIGLRDALRRPDIPGEEQYRLDDYLLDD
ncbi:MAG: UbiD family decarboxylase [Gammaproteobacteria bacterium]|nr:UbiD family decarboxylase [Gammaproteobacteria bacterium]MBT8444702.1 UbiD family decarboxylase [Gammaproteobacteria bacterium]NND36205.1 UbiD family decarboxylase [Gammaproteobacteria bacterium]